MGLLHFHVITITDRRMLCAWAYDLCAFSGCLMGKTREDKGRPNMTQMTSLLAVATVVIDLRTLFLQSETGAYT